MKQRTKIYRKIRKVSWVVDEFFSMFGAVTHLDHTIQELKELNQEMEERKNQ